MDSAFALYHSLGLDAIKSGYVTDFVGEGHSHYGQYMVRHHRHVIERAAQYGIMLDVHEPIHDAGERRTYPNMMSREGARGQEYNAWSPEGGHPHAHEPQLLVRGPAIDRDTTRVIAGKIGDYVIVARRERNGPSWYVGAITDEEARTFDVPLTFLTPGRKYVAEIYADGPGANWLTNPLPVTISKRSVDATSRLHLVLAPGGGQAIRIRPAR